MPMVLPKWRPRLKGREAPPPPPPEAKPEPRPALAPFKCARCGAVIPLGEGRSARCPYCAHETPLPEGYLSAQRAAREFAQATEQTRRLYGRLGKPPGRVALAIWKTFDRGRAFYLGPTFGCVVVPVGLVVLGFPVAWVTRAYFRWLDGRDPGPIPAALTLVMTWMLVVVGFGLPRIVLKRQHELTELRARVHANLAAAPPEHAGGPSRCHHCGAALDVPVNAQGVPCAHCRADNLVGLPAEWVARARTKAFDRTLEIASAVKDYREASWRAPLVSLFWLLIYCAIAVPIGGLLTIVFHGCSG